MKAKTRATMAPRAVTPTQATQQYRNLLSIFCQDPSKLAIPLPEGHILGWRVVHRDFRSRGGYRWPWPGGVAETPNAIPGGPCPLFEGDGLCGAITARGAAAGGIPLECVLITGHRPEDVLGRDGDKFRASRFVVLDLVDAQSWLRGNGQHADLEGASLQGAELRRADLQGASLWGADLRDADLRRADLQGASLWGADLRDADLRRADLQGASLQGANLTNANLFRSDLQLANLSKANLSGANLTNANLFRSDLQLANLSKANLSGANLKDVIGYIP